MGSLEFRHALGNLEWEYFTNNNNKHSYVKYSPEAVLVLIIS